MKVVNQSILSTKHLLTTNSEVIKFNAVFDMFFTIIGGEINPIVNDNKFIDNIMDYQIYISPNDVMKVDEMDDDSLYNTLIYNGRFYVQSIKNPEEIYEIKTEEEKEIFLTEETLALMKKGKGYIKFKDLDDDMILFVMDVMNNELTKPLYMIMELTNKAKKDAVDETIDSISQQFLELLIESGIDASVVAPELIINRLIRSVKHPYERPDFTKHKLEPYTIYTVRRALERNKSPLIGISYQNLKRQFLSDDLFTERNGTSYIDEFYRIDIPTDNLKMYSKLARKGASARKLFANK